MTPAEMTIFNWYASFHYWPELCIFLSYVSIYNWKQAKNGCYKIVDSSR